MADTFQQLVEESLSPAPDNVRLASSPEVMRTSVEVGVPTGEPEARTCSNTVKVSLER